MFPRTLPISAQKSLAILKKSKMTKKLTIKTQEYIAGKLFKITGKATKKDFIDLYFLTKKHISIEKMFNFYDREYHNLKSNILTLLKALQYFEDADGSDMPEMIEKINWEEVKKFFQKETIRLAEKYI